MTEEQRQSDYEIGPLVPMTLRIGVTGHRPNKLGESDPELLISQVRKVLTDLNSETAKLLTAEEAGWLYRNPTGDPHIRIVSALAEGADRIAVDRSSLQLDFNFELIAALPFDREEYKRDFQGVEGSVDEFERLLATADTVVELGGVRKEGDRAYERIGEFVVRQSDVLLAIWNPDEEKPGRGGTKDVIHRAVVEGLTVVCIDARAPHELTVRRRRNQSPKMPGTSPSPYTHDLLEDCLRQQLLFSRLFHEPHVDNDEDYKRRAAISDRIKDFVAEPGFGNQTDRHPDYVSTGPLVLGRKSPFLYGNIFRFLTNLLASKACVDKQKQRWQLKLERAVIDSSDKSIPAGPAGTAVFDRIFAAFLRADQLASYYSHLHRSTFMLIYISGGLALSFAAAALFVDDKVLWGIPLMYAFAGVEFVMLAVIFVVWRNDHKKRHHDRWIEYRSIAEFLRPMIHLSLVNRAYPLNKLREQQEEVGQERLGRGGPARSWVFMYVETILRWAGVNSIQLDSDGQYLRACRKFLNENWFADQEFYHSSNATRMHVLGKRLQKFSSTMFWLTALMVTLKLLSGFGPHDAEFLFRSWLDYTGLLAGVLPACGASAFAIRNHAEFDISAQRSMSMRIRFMRWIKRLDDTKESSNVDPLIDLLDHAAETTIREAADWSEIFEVKESETA